MWSGEGGVGKPKPRPAFIFRGFVGKKYKNLHSQIYTMDNMWLAYKKASMGKRATYGYLRFRENDAANLVELSNQIKTNTYIQSKPKEFVIFEPKRRTISAVAFHDRVVHHALVNIIGPIFEKIFSPYSFACRVDMGTHTAVKRAQSLMRKHEWYLKIDFSAFFASVDREVLSKEIKKKISCNKTLDLIQKIHPFTGKGIPIGSLTSQLFANVYGTVFDKFLSHDLKISNYVRYMDDTIVFGNSKKELLDVFYKLRDFVKENLLLFISRWKAAPVSTGLTFLGYRIWRYCKRIKRSSVIRARRKLKKLTGLCKERFVASWCGHVKFADSDALLKHLKIG
jgi:retron-type reverse transcriptase